MWKVNCAWKPKERWLGIRQKFEESSLELSLSKAVTFAYAEHKTWVSNNCFTSWQPACWSLESIEEKIKLCIHGNKIICLKPQKKSDLQRKQLFLSSPLPWSCLPKPNPLAFIFNTSEELIQFVTSALLLCLREPSVVTGVFAREELVTKGLGQSC